MVVMGVTDVTDVTDVPDPPGGSQGCDAEQMGRTLVSYCSILSYSGLYLAELIWVSSWDVTAVYAGTGDIYTAGLGLYVCGEPLSLLL